MLLTAENDKPMQQRSVASQKKDFGCRCKAANTIAADCVLQRHFVILFCSSRFAHVAKRSSWSRHCHASQKRRSGHGTPQNRLASSSAPSNTPQINRNAGAHCCTFPSTVLASLLFLSTYSLLNYNECYKRTVGRGVVLDTQ